MRFLLVFFIFLVANPVFSLQIKHTTLLKTTVMPIRTRPSIVFTLAFDSDDKIIGVEIGDSQFWHVTVDENAPNYLYIKPKDANLTTNMVVTTAHGIYFFTLHSVDKSSDKDETYALFVHRAVSKGYHYTKAQAVNDSVNPNTYNWEYSYTGDTDLLPLHVFDDGHKTYLQLRPHQVFPAVFEVTSSKGSEAILNTRWNAPYLILLKTTRQLMLRSGKKELCVFNDRAIKPLAPSKA